MQQAETAENAVADLPPAELRTKTARRAVMRTTSWTGQCAAQEAACEAASQGLVTKMEHENKEGDLEDAIRELDFLGSGEDREGSPDPRGLGDALEKGLTMSWKAVVCGVSHNREF